MPVNDLFLSSDYSQIELRILAHLSGSEALINAFVNGDDIHTKVASDIFKKPMNEVTPQEKTYSKSSYLWNNLWNKWFWFRENIGTSPKEAKEIYWYVFISLSGSKKLYGFNYKGCLWLWIC